MMCLKLFFDIAGVDMYCSFVFVKSGAALVMSFQLIFGYLVIACDYSICIYDITMRSDTVNGCITRKIMNGEEEG